MAVEVTLDAGTVRPIGGIGLPTLNNILVNACLNRKMYERAKNVGGGRDLTPRQCSSMRSAAYQFKPEVQFEAATRELPVRRGSRVDEERQGGGERNGGTVVSEQIDPEELLPGATDEQSVPYWLDCSTESDLVDNFKPNRIVDVMRPADVSSDRLGLLKRLRTNSATYAAIQAELRAGRMKELTDPSAPQALAQEAERLRAMLREVRSKMLRQIDRDDRIALTDRELIKRAAGDSGAYAVLDKKALKARLDAVVNAERGA